MKTLTDAELNEIERRAQHHHLDGRDVLALIAEVRRLREENARLKAQISVPPDHGREQQISVPPDHGKGPR